MSAFKKVLEHIKNARPNGHAQRNIANKKSLALAKREIEELLGKK